MLNCKIKKYKFLINILSRDFYVKIMSKCKKVKKY